MRIKKPIQTNLDEMDFKEFIKVADKIGCSDAELLRLMIIEILPAYKGKELQHYLKMKQIELTR